MIYTIGGQKGGGGKTTIAINLTIYLSSISRDVLLVDADDQETATDFSSIREEKTNGKSGFTSVQLFGTNVLKQIPKLAERYQDIVIDTGGRDTDSLRAALTVCNIFLAPFYPRSFDTWTLGKVEFLIEQAKVINPELKAFSCLSRADAKRDGEESEDNKDTADLLKNSNIIQYLDAPIVHRKSYSSASSVGKGIFELKPIDKKAVEEFNALIQHVIVTK